MTILQTVPLPLGYRAITRNRAPQCAVTSVDVKAQLCEAWSVLRHYPLAWERLAAAVHADPGGAMPHRQGAPAGGLPVDNASDPTEVPAEDPLLIPIRTAHVRAGIARKIPIPTAMLPDTLLQETADSAMWVTSPDGASSFEMAMHNELLACDDLRCRIAVGKGGVVAVFTVSDRNVQRLLEAESGRLRVALEERGFKGVQIQVVTEDPDAIGDLGSR